jgi:hypothetical protein
MLFIKDSYANIRQSLDARFTGLMNYKERPERNSNDIDRIEGNVLG